MRSVDSGPAASARGCSIDRLLEEIFWEEVGWRRVVREVHLPIRELRPGSVLGDENATDGDIVVVRYVDSSSMNPPRGSNKICTQTFQTRFLVRRLQ